jgi:hypothetical protein
MGKPIFIVFSFLLFSSTIWAAPDFETEFSKIAAAASNLTTFSASVDLEFAGKFVEKRPNFPRRATLYVATDGQKEDDSHRELELSLESPLGHYKLSFVLQGKVAYLQVQAPGKEPLAYFVDTANPKKERGQQMLSGLVVTTKARVEAAKQNKLGDVLGILQKKAAITLPKPGFIQLKDNRKEMDLDLFYDENTYLPKKVVIHNLKHDGHVTMSFNEWVLDGVSRTLPMDKKSYQEFGMACVGKLMQVLPQPKDLLKKGASSQGPELPEALEKTIEPEKAVVKKSESIKERYLNRRVRKEMQATVKELRSVIEVLQDKEFQRSLRKAGNSLKRLERHLQRLEELDSESN